MPNNTTIQLKRTADTGVAPTNLLANGELAVNLTDKRIFTTDSTGGAVFDAFQNTAANIAITGTTVCFKIGNSTVNVYSNSSYFRTQNSTFSTTLTHANVTTTNVFANFYQTGNIVAASQLGAGANSTNFLRGDLNWAVPAGGSGSPGGSNTQIQFNDSAAFAGDANLTWNKTTSQLFTEDLKVGRQYVIDTVNLGVINSTSNNSINCATGNYFTGTIGGAVSVTFTSIPATGNGYFAILELANVGVNITWASPNTKWESGTAPGFSSNTDVIVLITRDGGTTIRQNLQMRDSR